MTIRERDDEDPALTWASNKLKLVVIASDAQYDSPGSIEIEEPPQATMSNMTREEMDARLELVEARADARLSRFEERIDQSIGEMRRDRADLKADLSGLAAEQKSTRTTIIVTALATAVAIVGGVAAFNSAVLSNMNSSFESGKNTAQFIGEATKRLENLQERIEASQRQRDVPAGDIPRVPATPTAPR